MNTIEIIIANQRVEQTHRVNLSTDVAGMTDLVRAAAMDILLGAYQYSRPAMHGIIRRPGCREGHDGLVFRLDLNRGKHGWNGFHRDGEEDDGTPVPSHQRRPWRVRNYHDGQIIDTIGRMVAVAADALRVGHDPETDDDTAPHAVGPYGEMVPPPVHLPDAPTLAL